MDRRNFLKWCAALAGTAALPANVLANPKWRDLPKAYLALLKPDNTEATYKGYERVEIDWKQFRIGDRFASNATQIDFHECHGEGCEIGGVAILKEDGTIADCGPLDLSGWRGPLVISCDIQPVFSRGRLSFPLLRY